MLHRGRGRVWTGWPVGLPEHHGHRETQAGSMGAGPPASGVLASRVHRGTGTLVQAVQELSSRQEGLGTDWWYRAFGSELPGLELVRPRRTRAVPIGRVGCPERTSGI